MTFHNEFRRKLTPAHQLFVHVLEVLHKKAGENNIGFGEHTLTHTRAHTRLFRCNLFVPNRKHSITHHRIRHYLFSEYC